MTRTRLTAMFLLLIASGALADEPSAPVFDYELSVESHDAWTNHSGISVQYKAVMFRANSIEKVPGDAVWYPVYVTATSSQDGISAVAKQGRPFVGKPRYPPQKPLRAFYFQIESLQLKPNGQVPIVLKFKDATEQYTLRYVDGEGLRLEAVDAPHGKVIAKSLPEFVNIKLEQPEYEWQCNSLTVSASKNGQPLWSTDIPMQGQPKSLAVLDKVLFITATAGHSFYVLKDSGKLLFYDASVMGGKAPWDDIHSIWQREIDKTLHGRKTWEYGRFIRAAADLNDKRAIPLLFDSVENGFGLEEKCAAVAALEKFNGNSEAWPDPLPRDPGYFMRQIGMNRVFPAKSAKAERNKWETVFKDYLQK